MFQDLRFAVRMLVKRPAFAAVASLTLAIGIGATAAVFSLVQGVLLTSPPYQDPDRLVLIPSVRIDSQQVERIEATPAVHVDGLAAAARQSFESIAAYVWTFNFVVDAEGSESFEGMVVTPRLLPRSSVSSRCSAARSPQFDARPQARRRHSRLRLLAAPLQRRSRHHRQDDPYEPARARRRPSSGSCLRASVFCRRRRRRRSRTTTSNATVDFWMPAQYQPAAAEAVDVGRGRALETLA